jgi:hemerythrin
MSFVHWSPDLSVGIDFIDADHQKLMELLTEVHNLVGAGQVQVAVEKLDELIDFSRQHFHLEERLMDESNYSDFVHHKQLHGDLLQEVGELRQHLAGADKKVGYEIMEFLKAWLIRHIRESDKDLGGFLERKLGRRGSTKSSKRDRGL